MRVIVLSIAIVAAACGGSDSGPTIPKHTNQTVDVFTIQESFVQPSVTISTGDTIRWNFQKSSTDNLGHNVRFFPRITGSPADIGTQGNPLTSGTQSRVFSTKGDFNYVCDLHGGMTGDVVVQ
ncbi:MAG TPA: plastocyanin/azurin family copper-binding protein [Gemmatimonadaceae bacterium]|jgi:plastocyanin